jgi:hypothetical protein
MGRLLADLIDDAQEPKALDLFAASRFEDAEASRSDAETERATGS